MRSIGAIHVMMVAVLAGLFNLVPLLLASPGADVLFHYTLIECFAKQFWEGDLYPRWCVAANDGLGSPLFLFYFPFPYFVTSLFYPLKFFGFGAEEFYLASVGLANIFAVLTCCLWLREITTPGRALLCAVLFLFMPYRMEVLLFRTAFAELWCITWLPLLFLYTHRIALGNRRAWLPMAFSVILAMLSHAPLAYIGLMACGVQLLWMTGFQPKSWLPFINAVLVACVALAIYLFPAKYYMQFLNPQPLEFVRSVWVNNYASLDELVNFRRATFNRASVMVNLGITLLFVAGMALVVWRRRAGIANADARREMLGWLLVAAFSLFLLFPLSAPLWELFFNLSGIMTPWRAQVLLPFAILYLLATKMQWMMGEKQLKTWKCDYGALLGLFVILSLSVLTTRPPELLSLYRVAMDSMVVNAMEYRSRWTDEPVANRENIIARFQNPKKPEKAKVLENGGKVTQVTQDCCSITLDVDMNRDGIVHIEHFYFPIWHGTIDGKETDDIFPQAKTGFINMQVPQGKHRVELHRDLAYVMGLPYVAACFASLLGWAFLLYSHMRYRRGK